MSGLTEVELLYLEGRIERWVRFGHEAADRILDRRRRVLAFAPGAVFAFVRWASNDFGTAVSRIDILRAVQPGAAVSTIPFVTPGAQVLLHISGWPRVERVLQAIDQVEALGIDVSAACPEHWRHVHNRVSAGELPRVYSPERHRAWQLRQKIGA